MSEQLPARIRPPLALAALAALVALVAAAALALGTPQQTAAQTPPATEAQALSIERQLMCPQCPNERLDTCERAVCRDMKRIIREQLAEGRTPDDIILFFEMRYGPRVRADLPAEGFNLFLFGWVGGTMVAVAAAASWYLWSLRRRSRATAAAITAGPALETPDDAWLDAQLAPGEPPRGEEAGQR